MHWHRIGQRGHVFEGYPDDWCVSAAALFIPCGDYSSTSDRVLAGIWLWRRSSAGERTDLPRNPIALLPALGFLVFVALSALAVRWGLEQFGEGGIAVMLLLMGSMDVDVAIVTAGGLPEGSISPMLASLALAGTVLANMSVKLGITVVTGGRNARPAVIALASSMATLTGSVVLWWLSS